MSKGNPGENWSTAAHWKCGICWHNSQTESVFNDNIEFQDHIGRHCHISGCNKEYSSLLAWQRHQAIHYNQNVKKSGVKSSKTNAYCQFCGKVFPNSNNRDFTSHR